MFSNVVKTNIGGLQEKWEAFIFRILLKINALAQYHLYYTAPVRMRIITFLIAF